LFESDTLGNTQTEYVWLGNQRLATINNTGTYYSHNDHLGTPQLMTDTNGVIAWQADYEPFGKANVTTSIITNNFRMPGQYEDAETGLHYNYMRDYNPATGRYVQSDPIGLVAGLNTYAYALLNPMKFSDIFGLDCCQKVSVIDQGCIDRLDQNYIDCLVANEGASDMASMLCNGFSIIPSIGGIIKEVICSSMVGADCKKLRKKDKLNCIIEVCDDTVA